MTKNQIIDRCLQKPGAYIDFPFGPDVTVVKVGANGSNGRIFLQAFDLKGEPCVTFNCDRQTGEFYRNIYPDTVTRGYHCPPVQQPYFNTVKLNGTVRDSEIINMIDHSYKTVVAKLPKYIQKGFDLKNEQNNAHKLK